MGMGPYLQLWASLGVEVGSLGTIIEKRGDGSLCGSLFSIADDYLVPKNQAMYARVLSCT